MIVNCDKWEKKKKMSKVYRLQREFGKIATEAASYTTWQSINDVQSTDNRAIEKKAKIGKPSRRGSNAMGGHTHTLTHTDIKIFA
jgi:hypothetical protein